ncbi:tetratricopeptide repeat protein [Pontibacter pamirensis]|uniref:tetratricopeptide repeat protein n=1 Tax=Pontibacter pamirensis TaxID=2562824 RepID=UPI0013893FDC|nr:tetratricopeptide repeat protein [Pontibacter pamirensis]
MDDVSVVFLVLAFLVVITRPLTSLFHELGHAIPAILLTGHKVSVYIGSYGDTRRGVRLSLGLLEIWFRYNFFSWRLGLCVPSAKDVSVNKQIIYILAGPIASSVIAVTACYFTFALDLHGAVKLILIVFLGCSLVDLIVNLVPSSTPIALADGSKTYNDGYKLMQLLNRRSLPKEYFDAVDTYNREDYKTAAELFVSLISKGLYDESVYRLAISAYVQQGEYQAATRLIEQFATMYEMNSDDSGSAGLSYSQLGMYEKGIKYYEKSLQLDPHNKYTLNNMGYTLNLLGRYEEAIVLFDRAVEVDNLFANPYNNRGLAKIKSGMEADGLLDIERSFELDGESSYGYLNLGIYHLDRNEYAEALLLFQKAKQLDEKTYMIDELIWESQSLVGGNSKVDTPEKL